MSRPSISDDEYFNYQMDLIRQMQGVVPESDNISNTNSHNSSSQNSYPSNLSVGDSVEDSIGGAGPIYRNQPDVPHINHPDVPHINQPDAPHRDLSVFQTGLHQDYQQAEEIVEFYYPCHSLSIFPYYRDSGLFSTESTNTIIIPHRVLTELAKYDNIESPYKFRLDTDHSIGQHLLGVKDFMEGIDHIYVPTRVFNSLKIEEGEIVKLCLINEKIQSCIGIVVQPHTSDLLKVGDPAKFLEDEISKRYPFITKGETITIPISDSSQASSQEYFLDFKMNILDTFPSDRVCMLNTEVEISIRQPLDYVPPPKVVKLPSSENYIEGMTNDSNNKNDAKSTGFVSFSGIGRKVGDEPNVKTIINHNNDNDDNNDENKDSDSDSFDEDLVDLSHIPDYLRRHHIEYLKRQRKSDKEEKK